MKKVSKTKIAQVYALALYDAAKERNAVAKVSEDMVKLGDVVSADVDIVQYLANPTWDVVDKKEALKVVAQKLKLSPETLNCLGLIADNNRFGEFVIILDAFKHICYQKQGVVEVSVQAVKALNSAQDKKLQAHLEKMLSQKIVVNYEIKPELLGGLVIKFNSNMIDDSLKGKLNRLEIVMKGGQ